MSKFYCKYLKCWYTNATSLENKLNELKVKLSIETYDILFITESWCDDKSSPGINGFSLFRHDRQTGTGGGVCIYVNNDLKCKESILMRDFPHSEQVWCEIIVGSDTILLGCIYRPPNRAVDAASEEINESLVKARKLLDSGQVQSLLICGDFNYKIAWHTDGSHEMMTNSGPLEERFVDTLGDCFLAQCVACPTFQLDEETMGNTLDLVITDDPSRIPEIRAEPPLGLITFAAFMVVQSTRS